MTKEEVQKRVLQNGEPLSLDLFSWDEKTKTFSSAEDYLVLDFNSINNCTFKTSSDCTFKTGSDCTFKTGYNCTFKTGSDCTFDTGSDCTFDTGYNCTFDTGYNCTFKTGSYCTFKTGYDCVIVRRYKFEVIQPKENEIIKLNPYSVPGYISSIDGEKFYLNSDYSGSEYIIVDNILSEVISRKGSVIKVKNYNDTELSFIIEQNGVYSHGKTIKEAKESIIYKLSNRDTSVYKDLTLDSVLSKNDCIQMYMCITGACSFGTKSFVNNQSHLKEEYSVRELIELTEGQFGNETFKRFFI